jgi:hypothetical protein
MRVFGGLPETQVGNETVSFFSFTFPWGDALGGMLIAGERCNVKNFLVPLNHFRFLENFPMICKQERKEIFEKKPSMPAVSL